MQRKLIFLLVFMVLIAVFALQNSVEVSIKLWFWTVKTSMVLVLILTFAGGAIAGILFSLPRRSGGKVPKPIKPPEESPREGSLNADPPGGMDEYEDIRH